MARSPLIPQDDAPKARAGNATPQKVSVGDLLRPGVSEVATPSAKGCRRPPRSPAPYYTEQPPPRTAPAASRVPFERQRSSSVESSRHGRSGSPALAAQHSRQEQPKIVGAFRRQQSRDPSPRRSEPSSRASSADPRRGGRDIIAANRLAVQRPRAASAEPVKEARFERNSNNVPLYLQRVKSAIADEERIVAEKLGLNRCNDGSPPGHRLLSEYERREILDGLHKRKLDLDAQYVRLPLRPSTEAQKQRCHELEKALREIESDVVRFSRPKVYVKL
mmetsp:Transcript_43936/g.70243  ORF Transcript_43936/g.70243 Transcript_43936/m.70243 type:complete len:277 (+) Transcript_43936:56-886(+)|eukprot:CAMPEP_0169241590 /NCGR_PEP_ID=MMETSP1016-20121227/32088_1 /TAXON_ID=342587 /ORGANISM="Karlodinium micrum, Strain CCMP2283" /LENGTH=276 /DNA_ID=CAMNT_0009321725 /DNA_START=15 /DNA_END=845 /DNA_ORIENTATION=+